MEAQTPGARWPDQAYLDGYARFRRQRLAALTGKEGWLNLVGLYWLDQGTTTIGTGAENTIVLEPRPAMAGQPSVIMELTLAAGKVSARARPGALVLVNGEPLTEREVTPEATHLELAGLLATVIERGGHHGLRLRDLELDTQAALPAIDVFPLNRDLVLLGTLELWPQPRDVPVPNVTDWEYPQRALGELGLDIEGHAVRLLVLGDDPAKPLFLIVGDRTNGSETYGGGRYLYADPPGPDGRVVVDLNRLYNPPCVFTAWATCPLPPPQNRVPARLLAGERKIAKG